MEKLVVAKVVTLAALCGVGVAAPAAVWVVNHDAEIDARQSVRAGLFTGSLEVLPPAAAPRATHVVLDVTVISSRAEPAPAARGASDVLSEGPGRTCHDQVSETFAASGIRVCDVERTALIRGGSGVFGALDKPKQLAPRDLPSPSGLLEER